MTLTRLATPKADRYFEDYTPGLVYEFPETATVNEAEIIRFAEEYDPQYFHTDPAAAVTSPYKGIIASGGQTLALTFRLFVTHFLPGRASFGSPGMDEVRWIAPLRPGDVIRVRATILETRASRSKPGQGTVYSFVEAVNQNNEVIMSYKAINIMARRPA